MDLLVWKLKKYYAFGEYNNVRKLTMRYKKWLWPYLLKRVQMSEKSTGNIQNECYTGSVAYYHTRPAKEVDLLFSFRAHMGHK